MRLFAQILLWCSLGVGAVSAATAYLVSLDATDDGLIGLTLAASAGSVEQPDGSLEPIGTKDDPLTSELLAELRALGVKDLRVKEFSLGRWRGKWIFLISLVGLVAGGLLTRRGSRAIDATSGADKSSKTPQQILQALQQQMQQLHTEISKLPDEASQLELIVNHVGQFQRVDIPAFIDARKTLIAAHGLSHYAALMDRFAAAERQLNRAWSAAVDLHLDEATDCLNEAATLLEETRSRLSSFA